MRITNKHNEKMKKKKKKVGVVLSEFLSLSLSLLTYDVELDCFCRSEVYDLEFLGFGELVF